MQTQNHTRVLAPNSNQQNDAQERIAAMNGAANHVKCLSAMVGMLNVGSHLLDIHPIPPFYAHINTIAATAAVTASIAPKILEPLIRLTATNQAYVVDVPLPEVVLPPVRTATVDSPIPATVQSSTQASTSSAQAAAPSTIKLTDNEQALLRILCTQQFRGLKKETLLNLIASELRPRGFKTFTGALLRYAERLPAFKSNNDKVSALKAFLNTEKDKFPSQNP